MPEENNSDKSIVQWILLPLLNQRGEVGDPQDPPKDPPTKLTVEVNGEMKEFGAEDIGNLVAQQASATQKTQQVASLLKAVEKYGATPESFLENAEGSFAVMNSLIEQGVIDPQGNVIKTEPETNEPSVPPVVPGTPPATPPVVSKQAEVTMKALLKESMGGLTEEVTRLREDNVLLMRLRLSDNAKAKFSNLEDDDIAKTFAVAERDKTKTFMEHAEGASKAKLEMYGKLEKDFAKKHGIDLEEVQRKKLIEQDPSSGISALFGEKKMSFKKGKDNVSPRTATQEYFKHLDFKK